MIVKAGEQIPADGEVIEGAARKKTPNEIALQIFLVALSIIFILVAVSLYTYSIFFCKAGGN